MRSLAPRRPRRLDTLGARHRSCRVAKILVLLWLCATAGCKGGADAPVERNRGSGGSAASAATRPPPPPPPRLTCADLPGARRSKLQVSADGKAIYYSEQVAVPDGAAEPSFDLYAFELAGRAARRLVADVGPDAVVADDGTVVFSRATAKPDSSGKPRRLIMIAPPGKEPAAATGDLDGLRGLAIDRETRTIVFEHRNDIRQELWKLPLAGGKPERIASSLHYWMLRVVDGSILVTNAHRLARQPIAGGPMVDLADLDASHFMGTFRDRLVLLGKQDRKLALAPLAAAAKPVALALGTEELKLAGTGEQTYAIAKAGATYEVRALADPAARPILVTRGVRPFDVAPVSGQLAMLAFVDSNDDGELGGSDETDLCFAAPGPDPIDVPGRTVPKQLADLAPRLAARVATGPLAGAKLRFLVDHTIELTMATAPAGADLRILVKQAQDQVDQLRTGAAGLPPSGHLSVVLWAKDTGQRAISRWDDGVDEPLVTSGVGTAQIAERTQYAIEGDPKVTYERLSFGGAIGEATCSGTVKNISDHELSDLEVACAAHPLDDRHPARVKLRPSKLAPGASASYRIAMGYAGSYAHLGLFVYAAGKRLPYFNAYADKREAQIAAAATKVWATTKLAYWTMLSEPAPSFLTNVRNIYVVAPKSLEDGPVAELQHAAAQALPVLAATAPSDPRITGAPRLLILRGDHMRIGWTYANGKLTAAAPDD